GVGGSGERSTTIRSGATPANWRVNRAGASRSVNRECLPGSVGIYFGAGVASAGYTFTSTRRFLALLSGSDESAGLSHPSPLVENWFGCSDGNFRTIASFTALARFSDSSCPRLFAPVPRIHPPPCPSITPPAPPT